MNNYKELCFLLIIFSSFTYGQTLYLGEPPVAFGIAEGMVTVERSDSCHTLDFEGITDTATVSLGSFYEPWGYYFSDNSLVVIQNEAGGSGNFEFNPSGVAILFWLEGDSTIINIPAGFTTGFSFYYSSYDSATVEVFSGINGTGSLLSTMSLVETPPPTGYTYWYSNWVPIGVSFEDTAKSIVFSGVANKVGFDNITFCDSVPTPPDSCALIVTASADDSVVCPGDSINLFADVTGEYPPVTFEWWSIPPGFSSFMQNPNSGPILEDTWFIVRAIDSLGCEDIDSVLVEVLEDVEKDTSMCVGDTMRFCCNPICDSLGGSRAGSSPEIMVYHDGTPVPEYIAMDSDSCCMKFVPRDPGHYSVWQPNYYDGIHDCCYDVWWNITVCCTPQGSLRVELIDTVENICTYEVCFEDIGYPCDTCCYADSVRWHIGGDSYRLIYSEDFESDPGYVSMSPANVYWDNLAGNYYADVFDVSSGYGYDIAYSPTFEEIDGDFTVEMDFMIITPDWGSYPGVFFQNSNVTVDTSGLHRDGFQHSFEEGFHWSDHINKKFRLASLSEAITTTNQPLTNEWYNFKLFYNSELETIDWTIVHKATNDTFFMINDYAHPIPNSFNRLYIGKISAPPSYGDESDIRVDNIKIWKGRSEFYALCDTVTIPYNDTLEVCATAFTFCETGIVCSTVVCTTLTCGVCHCPPCSSEIVIDYPPDFEPLTDTLCLWDSLHACLDCPGMDSINWVNEFGLSIGSGTCIWTMFDDLDSMLYPVPGWRKLIAIAFACDETCYVAIESVFVDNCDTFQCPPCTAEVEIPYRDKYCLGDTITICAEFYGDSICEYLDYYYVWEGSGVDGWPHERCFLDTLKYPGWQEYCVTAYHFTPEGDTCEYHDCDSIWVEICEDCCTLVITKNCAGYPSSSCDTICPGDWVQLCAYLVGDTCPYPSDIDPEWTVDDSVIANTRCTVVRPDTTTEYCFNGWYLNDFGDTCFYDTCLTIYVFSPPDEDLWPGDTILCVGDSLVLPVPCYPYIPIGWDSTGGVEASLITALAYDDSITEPDPDTVAFFDLTSTPYPWCWVSHVARVPGCYEHIVCYNMFTEECGWWNWVECCTIYVCDTPSVELKIDSIPCGNKGSVEVCVINNNPGAPIDIIVWNEGDTTYWPDTCIYVSVDEIETCCDGVNGFEPETVWVKAGHICDSCGPTPDTCWDYDTLVIEPYFDFWITFNPTAIEPGDPFIITPHIDPPLFGIEVDYYECNLDGLHYLGTNIYDIGQSITSSSPDSTTIYCASFIYDSCEYWACDSIPVADSFLTIIKQPCAGDPEGWLEADGNRRFRNCEYTFPVHGGCTNICVSDTDFVMPFVWIFDRWETPLGTFYSDTSYTTYCLTSTHDTIFAIYSEDTMCMDILPLNTDHGDTSLEIEVSIEVNDSGFTADNVNQPRQFIIPNCGSVPLELKIKWLSTTNLSGYGCPSIEVTNNPWPDVNKISLRGGLGTVAYPPLSYIVIKDYYSNLISGLLPSETAYLYIGVVTPESYDPCWPQDVDIPYRINLKLRWGVYLP